MSPAHRAIFQAQQAAFEQEQEANDELRARVELLTDTNRRLEHFIGELRRAIYDKKSEKRPLDDRQLAFEDHRRPCGPANATRACRTGVSKGGS